MAKRLSVIELAWRNKQLIMSNLHNKDHELVRRDPALRGLPFLLNPARLLELLSTRLDTSGLSEFQLSYVRYKPGMNCLGRYEFQFNGNTLIAYAKAFSVDADLKLAKSEEVPKVDSPLGPGRLVLPEQGIFVSFFPNDLKLRSILRLGDPAERGRLLGRIFNDSEAWGEAPDTILNYKPERRLVLRVTGPGGCSSTVKFYTRREFSRNMHLRKRNPKSASVLMPRCIGASRKHCAFAFEWTPGETLRSYSSDLASRKKHFREAGKLIARYHTGHASGLSAENDTVGSQALAALADQLAFLLPELGDRARDLAAGLQSSLGGAPAELCPVHGDFYDKQIIVGSDGLSLIDFDRAHRGSACEDLACFLAHQEWLAMKSQGSRPDVIAQLSAAFLAGYADAGGQFEHRQLDAWTALYLFRLSHNPFRDRSSNWPDQIAKILQRAEDLLCAGPERSRRIGQG